MIQKELEQLVRKWQEILRLQDWEIEVEWVTRNKLDKGSNAEETLCVNQKAATIGVIMPEHYSVWNDKPQDIEESVVHELLHIPLQKIENYARKEEELALDNAVESATNLIAAALIMLDRRAT